MKLTQATSKTPVVTSSAVSRPGKGSPQSRPRFFVRRQSFPTIILDIFLLAFAAWLGASSSYAGVLVQAQNVGSDLLLSYSGTWDTTSYGSPSSSPAGTAYAQLQGSSVVFDFYSDPGLLSDLYQYRGATSATFISNYASFASTSVTSGSPFRVYLNTQDSSGSPTGFYEVSLPSGYVSGTTFSGSVTFTGRSIASVFGSTLDGGPQVVFRDDINAGISPVGGGAPVTIPGNNTITFQAVPEPSTYAMLIAGGLTAVGAAARRRRRQAVSAL